MTKLNIGAGSLEIPGYIPIDRSIGSEAYPLLQYADGSVDTIRASHVLEHFSHRITADVVKEWVRVLKPGGILKIAVPDFDKAITAYNTNDPLAHMYIMGGHENEDDRHHAIFNHESLAKLLTDAGLIDVEPWDSDLQDCAALPVSLNLQGRKPNTPLVDLNLPKMWMVGSIPRIGFVGNDLMLYDLATRYRMTIERVQGALWGQCLQRGLERAVEAGVEWVMTFDYDTVATWREFEHLVKLMHKYPDAAAIAPLQMKRSDKNLLIGLCQDDGTDFPPGSHVSPAFFDRDLVRCKWAHFGFTIIRVSALKSIPKPWFKGEPSEDGTYNGGHIDDDIYFWKQFEKAGHKVYVAAHCPIGHLQQIATWPNQTLTGTIYQHVEDFTRAGPPLGARK